MVTLTINGKTYDIPEGKSVKIVNGKLFVDGMPVDDTEPSQHSVITGTIDKPKDIIDWPTDLFRDNPET